jgi:hypothetical protein
MRHITVIAELGSTIAYFTVHESSIGHFRPGRGETGCTILGLTKRYGLGERELNIVRALKFNESATFEVPDIVTPVQVTPPKAEPRAHMPALGDTSLPWEAYVHPWDGARVLGPQQPDRHRRIIAGYLDIDTARFIVTAANDHAKLRTLLLRVRRNCSADVQLLIDEICGS